MEQHNKIINEVAKSNFKQEGLFRVGSSRSWIEDNNYFLINVNFEPSGFNKGSYLSVAISFLWEYTTGLNETLGYNYGGRVFIDNGTQYVEYKQNLKSYDELFTSEIEKFANAALLKVKEYRRFNNLEYAKKMLKRSVDETQPVSQFWELYDLSMLCFFKGDYDDGKKCFNDFLALLKKSFYLKGTHIHGSVKEEITTYIKWREDFYNYCLDNIVPNIRSVDAAQRMVYDMINRRRTYFNSKSSYKKMKKNAVF